MRKWFDSDEWGFRNQGRVAFQGTDSWIITSGQKTHEDINSRFLEGAEGNFVLA